MLDSPRLNQAFNYASAVHGSHGQRPARHACLGHPLEVAALVATYGGDDDQMAAALLHEVIDVGGVQHASPINRQFGPRVLRLVLDCSSNLGSRETSSLARQQRQLRHLAEVAADSLLVSACAWLHGARRLLAELRRHGGARPAGLEVSLGLYRSAAALFSTREALPARALQEVVASLAAWMTTDERQSA